MPSSSDAASASSPSAEQAFEAGAAKESINKRKYKVDSVLGVNFTGMQMRSDDVQCLFVTELLVAVPCSLLCCFQEATMDGLACQDVDGIDVASKSKKPRVNMKTFAAHSSSFPAQVCCFQSET